MATKKKARVPAPPRPVQAPKRRDGKGRDGKQPSDAAVRRSRWYLYALAAAGPIALAIVLAVVFLGSGKTSGGGGKAALGPEINLAGLPGMRRTKGLWDQGLAGLPDRLKPIGLTALPQEALQQHIHQHIDIYIDGKHVVPPGGIGIYDGEFITEIHTHSAGAEGLPGPTTRPTGVIHVESPSHQTYGLGQFFGVWGVYLSRKCIGGYCVAPGKPLRIYVNGKQWTDDPTRIPLREHDEFAVVYGKAPAKIPSTFTWTPSL